ncbi:MAG: T9SS type A sorting domain-containing protein [Polaribacter sp.]
MNKNYIFKFTLLALLGLCLNTANSYAQTDIAAYQGRNDADPLGATGVANITVTPLSRGAGVSVDGLATVYATKHWQRAADGGLDDAISDNDYIEWSIKADAGYTVSISQIQIVYNRNAQGPTSLAIRTSLDNYSNNIFSDDAVPTTAPNPTPTITLANTLTSANGETITFRLYGYNAGNFGGYLAVRSSLGANLGQSQTGIILKGSVDEVVLPTITWDGSESTDWATPGNWDTNTVPTANENVIIADVANAPVIGSSTNAITNNLTINEADGVTISSGGTLIVNGSSTGEVTYNRNLGSENWYLISSPVDGERYTNVYFNENSLAENGSLFRAFAPYLPATNEWDYTPRNVQFDLNPGQGYAVKRETGAGAGDISFTGTINTESVVTESLSTGFNLIGNPYTSYVNSATFLGAATSANIDQTQIWLWNQATGMYEVKTSGMGWILPPAQGFFVNATEAGTVTFDESNQVATGNTFQKTASTEVTLFLTDGENNRFAKLNFGANFSTNFDYGWEGETFGGLPSSLSVFTSLVSDNVGKKYQVQSLPNSDYESMVIPIGVTAAAGKDITFTAEALNLPSDIKVFLEDTVTNTMVRLDELNSEYKVTFSENVDSDGRFYLHTKSSSVLSTSEVSLDNVSIFTTNASTLRITGLSQGEANVKLFNILGKQVFENSFESSGTKSINLPILSSGIYIFQLAMETSKLNRKIILE